MDWLDDYELELAPMDATHREFVELFNRLASADAASRLERLDEFIEHTEAHFGQENRWMEAVNFPGCHRAEHDRVLAVLREVRARLAAGDGFFLGRLIEELPAWFGNHASGMDAALAFTLKSVGFDFDTQSVPDSVGGCASDAGSCACGPTTSRTQALAG